MYLPSNYINDPAKNPLGITEHEALWDTIKHDRLIELMNTPNVTVHVEESENSYGEWLFVSIRCDWFTSRYRNGLMVYGCGYDWNRDVESARWRIASDEVSDKDSTPLNEALKIVNERHAEYEVRAAASKARQSKTGKAFGILASFIGDEDGTLAEFEDMGGFQGALDFVAGDD